MGKTRQHFCRQIILLLSETALNFVSRNNAAKISGALQQKRIMVIKQKKNNRAKPNKMFMQTLRAAQWQVLKNHLPLLPQPIVELFFFFFFKRGTKSKLIKDTGSNGSGKKRLASCHGDAVATR